MTQPFPQLEKAHCKICDCFKFLVRDGVCGQCRGTSLAEAERLLANATTLLNDSIREDHPMFTLENRKSEVSRYQHLVDFLVAEDYCKEEVTYVLPPDDEEVWKRCDDLVKAGATNVGFNSRGIVVTWNSKQALAAWEKEK